MEQQEQIQNMPTPPAKKGVNVSIPAAIITAGAIIALALIFSGKGISNEGVVKNNQPKPSVEQQVATAPSGSVSVRDGDYVRGDIANAQVVIVEYSDSDCPYCQRFHTTMKDVLKKYGSKVAWVYRYFPLDIHPDANNEAVALECVGQLGGNEKFWNYLDQIMDITVSPDKSSAVLTSTATALGVDAKALSTCLSNPATAKKVAAQSAEAQTLGAQGTPYSIAINKSGKQVVIAGAYPIEEVSKTIDSLMK
jgi:protein-disulfide isomerase